MTSDFEAMMEELKLVMRSVVRITTMRGCLIALLSFLVDLMRQVFVVESGVRSLLLYLCFIERQQPIFQGKFILNRSDVVCSPQFLSSTEAHTTLPRYLLK